MNQMPELIIIDALRQFRATVSTMSQEQIDAVVWILGHPTNGPEKWTRESMVKAYQDRLTTEQALWGKFTP